MMGEKSKRFTEAVQAFSRNDLATFSELLLSDDVVWHWGGRSKVSGDYRGRQAALTLLSGFRDLTSNRLKVEPLDLLEGENFLMSFSRVTADREGQRVNVIMCDAMRFNDEGRVAEFWTLSNDQAAVDSFLS